MLVELLVGSENRIVTYDSLYHEVLGRHFDGDTSNMRVLLGKLGASARRIGISVRRNIDVIAKTGYRYRSN
jgi:DNA-binding response OmpR family regulator